MCNVSDGRSISATTGLAITLPGQNSASQPRALAAATLPRRAARTGSLASFIPA